MTFEIAVVLVILVAAVALLATERLPVDLVALLVAAALMTAEILSVEEAIAGFANPATVTVAGMFVLSAGLSGTGAVESLGRSLAKLGKRSPVAATAGLMIGVSATSAFINNTAAVAVLLPVVLAMARETGTSSSKLLIPLSFAAIFGGTCTLIGTSTNLLTSSIAEAHGLSPIGMFELSPLGVVLLAAGTVYMITVGLYLLPARRTAGDLTKEFELHEYLTEIVLLPHAASVGTKLSESPLIRDIEMSVIEIARGGERITLPRGDTVLRAADVLLVRASVEKIRRLQDREGIAIRRPDPLRVEDLRSDRMVLVEAVLSPTSAYVGKTLEAARFRDTVGGSVLAIRHRGQLMREGFAHTALRPGDALLIEVGRESLPRLRQDRGFVVVSEIQHERVRKRKAIPALAIVAGVVAVAAAGVVPIVGAAVVGCVLMVLAGCTTLEEAYRAIEWKVIVLLAGMLSLGAALDKTGAARLIAETLVSAVGAWGPAAVLSVLYLVTSLLTEVMSNIAAAVLLVPIAIVSAEGLGCDPRPFLMAVTYAASASFMTPVGYQTNTLVYGPGGYRFSDFLRVGAPLNLLFWVLATVLIPRFWPLCPWGATP